MVLSASSGGGRRLAPRAGAERTAERRRGQRLLDEVHACRTPSRLPRYRCCRRTSRPRRAAPTRSCFTVSSGTAARPGGPEARERGADQDRRLAACARGHQPVRGRRGAADQQGRHRRLRDRHLRRPDRPEPRRRCQRRHLHRQGRSGDATLTVSRWAARTSSRCSSSGSGPSTGIGIVLALIVLGLAFGALFAAFLPLITALVAIGIGYSVTGLLSHVLLGRQLRDDPRRPDRARRRRRLRAVHRHPAPQRAQGGHSVEEAASAAVNTAGRAVFFAGLTVCIALLGQFALGLSFLYGVAVSAAVTVAADDARVADAAAGAARLRRDARVLSRQRAPRPARASGPHGEDARHACWCRWARLLERHPVRARGRGAGSWSR